MTKIGKLVPDGGQHRRWTAAPTIAPASYVAALMLPYLRYPKKKYRMGGAGDADRPFNKECAMSWTTVNFGRYAGKTLPEIILCDADWIFWALSKDAFKGKLAYE